MRARLLWWPLALAITCASLPDMPTFAQWGGKVVASVSVTPDTMLLQKGESGKAQCYPRNKSGTLLTNTCSWASSDTTIATPSTGSQTSSVTARKAGSVNVAVKAGTVSKTMRVVVTDTTSSPPPLPAPVPAPTSIVDSCIRHVPVNTLGQFTAALAASLPGDCIDVAAGTYVQTGIIDVSRSGTAVLPITIQGAGSSTVINVNQTQFNLDASYIHFRKLRFTNFGVSGFWAHHSSYNVLDSVEIDHTVQWALTWKDGSAHNLVENSSFHDTGTGAHPEWGEAIYISNSGDPGYPLDTTCVYNEIRNNHFGPNVRSMGIILSRGADHTTIQGNTFDGSGTAFVPGYRGLIASYGNYTLVRGNTMVLGRPDGVVWYNGYGGVSVGSLIDSNTVDLRNQLNFTTNPYYGFNFTVGTDSPAHVTLKCSNTVTNILTGGGFSNVTCVP